MKKSIVDTVVVGVCGAASVIITDAIVTRVDPINRSRIAMGASRVSLGLLGAFGLDKLDAPSTVSRGVAAGPIMVTVIDAFVSSISRSFRQSAALPAAPTNGSSPVLGPLGDGGVINELASVSQV